MIYVDGGNSKGMADSIPVCHIDWWSLHLDIDLLILFEDLKIKLKSF